jgi:hypothetical protein
MWMIAPTAAGPKSKWNAVPPLPSSIDAIMVSWEISSEAMCNSGVKNPVSLANDAIIAYPAIASEASTPAPAPHTNARPSPIRDAEPCVVSTRITMHSPLVALVLSGLTARSLLGLRHPVGDRDYSSRRPPAPTVIATSAEGRQSAYLQGEVAGTMNCEPLSCVNVDTLETLAAGSHPWAPGQREDETDMERAATDPDRTWCMSEVDIFADLDEAEMDAMAAAAPMKTYPVGALIYTPHQPIEVLFILKRGRIRIFRVSPDGRALTTAIINPGTIFGEMVIVGQQMHDSFAEALDDVVVCLMTRTDVQRLLLGDPRIAARISEPSADDSPNSSNASPTPSSSPYPHASPEPSASSQPPATDARSAEPPRYSSPTNNSPHSPAHPAKPPPKSSASSIVRNALYVFITARVDIRCRPCRAGPRRCGTLRSRGGRCEDRGDVLQAACSLEQAERRSRPRGAHGPGWTAHGLRPGRTR